MYADLSVLVVSSDNEGTPVSAIEGMASGLAVVATRVGGIPDLIDDGETGYLVPPGDAYALASAISTVMAEPEARVGSAARVAVSQRYAVERLVAEVESLYDELLRDRGVASRRY